MCEVMVAVDRLRRSLARRGDVVRMLPLADQEVSKLHNDTLHLVGRYLSQNSASWPEL